MRQVLRFAAGAAIALAIWWYATPAYDAFLCSALHVIGVAAAPFGRAVRVTRADAWVQVSADQLTYNVILFGGLVAAMPPRRVWRGVAAFLVLSLFHAIALFTAIESTFESRAGPYRDFWTSAEFIYRIGGMFAIAFVCWYAATWTGARESRPETPPAPGRRARARRKARGSRR